MKTIKFTHYYYRETCGDNPDPKLFISLDWFKFEDDFKRLYNALGKPDHTPEVMEQKQAQNENRHRWFSIMLNICGYRFQLEIRIAKVGLFVYGKYRDTHESAKQRREMLERRRKKRAKLD